MTLGYNNQIIVQSERTLRRMGQAADAQLHKCYDC